MTATTLTPLTAATDARAFGGKAAQLAAALGAGLPVPNGVALDWTAVRAMVAGDRRALAWLDTLEESGPWAVRSSAIGEDSAEASFAGTHLTLLGVVGVESLLHAIHQVHDSGLDEAAAAYRRQHGLDPAPRMAVVLQPMIASEVAGVLFTKNPVTGASERVIEASWGLGETVVSGLVSPDQYRLAPEDGRLLGRWAGEKDVALRLQADGSVAEMQVTTDLVEAWCLAEEQLLHLHQLAAHCDRVFGSTEHDIEFAFADDRLHLLQRRPITYG
ncbi:PEP/pyruvate-binding domain-containing protein [Nocardioides sp.]|uniref:PEP/pyruvate-binding domain-containing protein n=1 Tax=Nocardioides sp. TaxID=35761 RepID=UPI0026045438|nr:PEP/pyruvate-binding domain-containing protein [Nocardioides sp.]MDI6908907.1 PEP/pyruvate-binding domain-containing protein [Nocardioides sp.]